MDTSLLFYPPSGLQDFPGEVVCAVEHGQFCHCAARVSDTEVIEAVISGVRQRPYEPHGRDARAVERPCPLNVEWLRAQVGKAYDLAAPAVYLLSHHLPAWVHIVLTTQGRWDCSLLCLVGAGMAAEGYGLTGPVTPDQLSEMVRG